MRIEAIDPAGHFSARKFRRYIRVLRGAEFPGSNKMRAQKPKDLLKLLILLVAGAGFEPATFGL
jgi:hypothetical protein